jgi:hypothetical protein
MVRAQLGLIMCGGLQGSTNSGETVLSVCSETCVSRFADGSEVGNIRAEEVLRT